jgi:hypothetical protein
MLTGLSIPAQLFDDLYISAPSIYHTTKLARSRPSTSSATTMAPVIWGLDLANLKWSSFSHANVFNPAYHNRKTKIITYQLAMVLCVVSESLGTDCISRYNSQHDAIRATDGSAEVHNSDYVGIASFNIFMGIAVATVFGSAFFFDVVWPERRESPAVKKAWRIAAIITPLALLADAIAMTVIVARGRVWISGVEAATQAQLTQVARERFEVVYRRNARVVAALVLLWCGWVATMGSSLVMVAGLRHDEVHGPWSQMGLEARMERKESVVVIDRDAELGGSVVS